MPDLRRSRKSAPPRIRAFGWFLFACFYAVFAHQLAARFAHLIAPAAVALTSRLLFLLLLLVGFAAMGATGQRQPAPVAAMGLPGRPGYGREWALGAALGWSGVVAAILPSAIAGGLLVSIAPGGAQTAGRLLFAILALLAAALTQELLFRGYPFQRLMEAIGLTLATIMASVVFAAARTGGHAGAGTFLTSLLLGFLLAMAYLRTRALWLGWGFHFAWNSSMGLLFGLPVSGTTAFSPVFSTYATGPASLTGEGYGPEGSAVAVLVLLALLIATSRATRDLRHRWATPEITGAGIPVDLDAASRRQHEQAMGSAATPSETPLIQILPASSPAPPRQD